MTGTILVDTSVWIAHFRRSNPILQDLLANDRVLMQPYVLLEIACGTPPTLRARTLASLSLLQPAPQASTSELLGFIDRHQLYDQGCGMVDISLLASARLVAGARLWTLDTSLRALAQRLELAWEGPASS